MSILTIGGDMRYACLTHLAVSRSMDISAIGLEQCPLSLPQASLDDISRAQAVILPNPWLSGLVLPYAGCKPFTLDDVLSRIGRNTRLLLSDTACMPPLPSGLHIEDLSRDETYVLQNARLTAEGAIASAMNRSDRAIMDSVCLVIGCGRIGSRLVELLVHMKAKPTAVARRKCVLEQMEVLGAGASPMEALPRLLPKADFIFSTPPDPVLDEAMLRLIRPDALLMDLASPPYGFDLSLAQSLSLNAVRENGLPGRYCPLSAGMALLDAVQRILAVHPKGD